MTNLFTNFSVYRIWKTILGAIFAVLAFIYTPGDLVAVDAILVTISTVGFGLLGWTLGHFLYKYKIGYED